MEEREQCFSAWDKCIKCNDLEGALQMYRQRHAFLIQDRDKRKLERREMNAVLAQECGITISTRETPAQSQQASWI